MCRRSVLVELSDFAGASRCNFWRAQILEIGDDLRLILRCAAAISQGFRTCLNIESNNREFLIGFLNTLLSSTKEPDSHPDVVASLNQNVTISPSTCSQEWARGDWDVVGALSDTLWDVRLLITYIKKKAPTIFPLPRFRCLHERKCSSSPRPSHEFESIGLGQYWISG